MWKYIEHILFQSSQVKVLLEIKNLFIARELLVGK